MAALFILYFILFTFLAWRRLDWAVLAAIFALPSYLIRFSLGHVPMTLLEAMVIIVFAVWLIKTNFKFFSLREISRREIIFSFQFFLIVFFLLAATISVFVSPDLRAALGAWKAYFIEPILFFVVLKDLLCQKQLSEIENLKLKIKNLNIAQIISVLSFSALILSVFAIYQKFTGFLIPHPWDAEAGRRVTSIFEYPNALALFLAPLIPLFLSELMKSITRKKLLVIGYWLLVIIGSLTVIVWARSTGALVGIVAGLFFMAAISVILSLFKKRGEEFLARLAEAKAKRANARSRIRAGFLAAFGMTVLIVGFFVIAKSASLRSELSLNDWSGQVRRQMWKETTVMLKDRPILGVGLAGYQTTVAPYHKDKNIEIFLYPHNIILNFWSETGLFGLLAFLLLIANFFYLGFKKITISDCHSRPLRLSECEASESRNPRIKNWMPDQVRHDIKGGKILLVVTLASMVVILVHGLVDAPYFKNDLAILFWIIYAMAV